MRKRGPENDARKNMKFRLILDAKMRDPDRWLQSVLRGFVCSDLSWKMWAKLVHKMNEKNELWAPQGRNYEILGCLLEGQIFDEILVGKTNVTKSEKWAPRSPKSFQEPQFSVGPAECAGPVGDYRGFKNLKIWERILSEIWLRVAPLTRRVPPRGGAADSNT